MALDVRKLRYFVSVFEEGSFRRRPRGFRRKALKPYGPYPGAGGGGPVVTPHHQLGRERPKLCFLVYLEGKVV